MGRSFLLLLATVLQTGLCAAFTDKPMSDEDSPNGDILVEHDFHPDGTDQIWLVSKDDPGKRHHLYTDQRHATVLFSSNEEWLVINDDILSNQSNLLLFHLKKPLEYEQVSNLTKGAWSFFAQKNKNAHWFEHSYVFAIRWADDNPSTLLLCVVGHTDSSNQTSVWYCQYDVRDKSFSTEFDAHNNKNTTLAAK